jgi:predicted aldo/keto reductase-like oxidoreductase
MKKKILQIITITLISAFFTSCTKCVDCANCPDEVTLEQTELCQDDFESNDDYNSAVAVIEAFGCECQ